LASEQGNAEAKFNLGIIYSNELNNYFEAIKWFKLVPSNSYYSLRAKTELEKIKVANDKKITNQKNDPLNIR
jgi:hypothetical protein